MSDRRQALLRPVPVERISFDAAYGGQPCVRDTGILVADVSFELGREHLSDGEVLERHLKLEPADLDAVRTYSDPRHAPIEFDVLLDGVLGQDPVHDDVLTAYLFLPRIVLSLHQQCPIDAAPSPVSRSSPPALSAQSTSNRGDSSITIPLRNDVIHVRNV